MEHLAYKALKAPGQLAASCQIQHTSNFIGMSALEMKLQLNAIDSYSTCLKALLEALDAKALSKLSTEDPSTCLGIGKDLLESVASVT